MLNYKPPRGKKQRDQRNALLNYLRAKGWAVWKLGAGKYVSGWPDYYAFHKTHGSRWIETKDENEVLTPAQVKRFVQMDKAGVKIFVLETWHHYNRLFSAPNWRRYWKDMK